MKILVRPLKPLLKKHPEIIDLIIFGSAAKSAIHQQDIDIALLAEKEINRDALKKEIEGQLKKKIDLQILSLKDYHHFIWIALIREGFSVKHNLFLHQLYRIKPVVLFTYSLKSLTASKKVMFERAIKHFKDIEKLSNRVVLVPIEESEKFSDFLKYWGIDFESKQYGLLPLMRKEL